MLILRKENERYIIIVRDKPQRRPTSCKKDIASVPSSNSTECLNNNQKKIYVENKDEYLQIFYLSASQATFEGPRTARSKKLTANV